MVADVAVSKPSSLIAIVTRRERPFMATRRGSPGVRVRATTRAEARDSAACRAWPFDEPDPIWTEVVGQQLGILVVEGRDPIEVEVGETGTGAG